MRPLETVGDGVIEAIAAVLNNTMRLPAKRAACFAFARDQDQVASGALKPVVDRTFRPDGIAEAHRCMETNMLKGKIVVTT